MGFSKMGDMIKVRRKFFRLTQADLAEMAGVSHNTVYKIERGQGNPTLQVLADIGGVLGLEIGYLIPADKTLAP